MEDRIDLIELEDDDLMLTTIDNPYSPKTDYINWKKWDVDHGHYTEELLARITNIPDNIDDPATIESILYEGQLFIVENDPSGMYKLV